MAAIDLTAARLREVLDYGPETGVFTRRVRTAQCHQVGDRADFVVGTGGQKGYYRVSLDGHRHLAHRLAWLHVYGKWPDGEIDHIDGDRGNNRIENLRDVPRQINAQNFRRATKRNKRGTLLGSSFHEQNHCWVARITVARKSIYIGSFDTEEQAHLAYLAYKRKHHIGCTL